MNNIVSKLIEYYDGIASCELVRVPETLPRDILSAAEIFEFVQGNSDIVITEGVFADFKRTSSLESGHSFFTHRLKINAKNLDLSVKNIAESLARLGINSEKNFIIYETEEYQARFSNTKIIATIVLVNCREVARINYSKAIKGEQLLDVKQIIEYDLDSIKHILNETSNLTKLYDEHLKEEFENYIDDDRTLENLYLILDRYLLDVQMHKEMGRFILAYKTLLNAVLDNEYIRLKTGTYSEKYKENIETINDLYSDIVLNMIEKYKEQE